MTTEPTNPLEVRMARLEGSFEQINLRLTSLETQVSEVRKLRADTNSKLETLRADMDRKTDKLHNLILVLSFGALAALITVFELIN